MRDLDVAVVVVTYRSAHLTIECLRSISRELATSGARIRCVVVDNASGDAPSVAAEVERCGWGEWASVLVAERNGGFAYGNNIGLRAVYGTRKPDYVHLLNPDTELRPGAIGSLVRFLESHPSAGVAGGVFDNGDDSEWAVAFRFPSLISEVLNGLQWGFVTRRLARWQVAVHMGAEPCQVDWVSGASMMVRGSVVEMVGGLDEGFFLYFEETEFCHRVKAAGHGVWYVPDSRVLHWAGQSTKVTERNVAPRRLPGYWFESRVRYFVLTRGKSYATLVDAAALVAGLFGRLKRLVQSRPAPGVPSYLSDLLAHSPLLGHARSASTEPARTPRF